MINTQIALAGTTIGAAVVLVFTTVIRAVLPDPSPPFIKVHGLVVTPEGQVIQDRTVSGDGAATIMTWAAQIEVVETSQQVRGCVGGGTWPYQSGRAAPVFDLPDWVGNPACTLDALPRDVFLRPRAVFRRGDEEIAVTGGAFVVRHSGAVE